MKNPNSSKADSLEVKNIKSAFAANVWEVKCKAGAAIKKGDTLVILEAMKMEYPVTADIDGIVAAVHAQSNSLVQQGDLLVSISVSGEEFSN